MHHISIAGIITVNVLRKTMYSKMIIRRRIIMMIIITYDFSIYKIANMWILALPHHTASKLSLVLNIYSNQ